MNKVFVNIILMNIKLIFKTECTYFSRAYVTFSTTGHKLIYQTSLKKLQRINIIQCMLSNIFERRDAPVFIKLG